MARNNGNKPALNIEDDRPVTRSFKLSAMVAGQVDIYAEFYEQQTGRRPSPDKIVQAALEQVFGGDRAFQKFLATPRPDVASSNGSAATPAPSQRGTRAAGQKSGPESSSPQAATPAPK